MTRGTAKRGLGRGLSALMADIQPSSEEQASQNPSGDARVVGERKIPIEQIVPNPDQPRRHFEPTLLEELAASIRTKGILQPLIVRPDPSDKSRYQIVVGERRWRAAQIAQLHEVPALIRDLDDIEVLEVGIIENIQRAELNPLEEAQGYRQLMEKFGHTQEQLSEAMGKSRSHLANLMRLLQLPDEVQNMLRDGLLSAGHARALITAADPISLAREVVKKRLSVRETEAAAKDDGSHRKRQKTAPTNEKDADTRMLESDLSAALGMGVVIKHDVNTGDGIISIKYKDLSQLDDLMRLLNTA